MKLPKAPEALYGVAQNRFRIDRFEVYPSGVFDAFNWGWPSPRFVIAGIAAVSDEMPEGVAYSVRSR